MRMRGCCMCARALSCIHCATLSHLPPIHVHRLRKYLGLARLLPTTRSRTTPQLFSPILRRFAFSSAASFFFLPPCVHALFRSLINQKQANHGIFRLSYDILPANRFSGISIGREIAERPEKLMPRPMKSFRTLSNRLGPH